MLIELLNGNERIQFENNVLSWEQAIIKGATPLHSEGIIEERYIEQMIANVKEIGPYIVIAPKIALAHARPEDGVNKLGITFLISEKPVLFSCQPEHAASLVITLAAPDSNSHLSLLSDLALVFAENNSIEGILKLKTEAEVLAFLQHCIGGE